MITRPKHNPDSGFDRVAGYYDALARLVFGRVLERAQVAFLTEIRPGSTLLLVGGGSGWLLEQVLRQCRPERVWYVEASGRMLERARRRVGNDPRVVFQHGNETSLDQSVHVDVVMTPFLLDLFTEDRLRGQLLPRLFTALTPSGRWFCTDFAPPQRSWQVALLAVMYGFFGLTARIEARRMPHWPSLLESVLDLQPTHIQSFWKGFILSGIWQPHARPAVLPDDVA